MLRRVPPGGNWMSDRRAIASSASDSTSVSWRSGCGRSENVGWLS
jgi:hypothetical protein